MEPETVYREKKAQKLVDKVFGESCNADGFVANTMEITNVTGRRHCHVLHSVRKLIQVNPGMHDHFKIKEYRPPGGEKGAAGFMTREGFEALVQNFHGKSAKVLKQALWSKLCAIDRDNKLKAQAHRVSAEEEQRMAKRQATTQGAKLAQCNVSSVEEKAQKLVEWVFDPENTKASPFATNTMTVADAAGLDHNVVLRSVRELEWDLEHLEGMPTDNICKWFHPGILDVVVMTRQAFIALVLRLEGGSARVLKKTLQKRLGTVRNRAWTSIKTGPAEQPDPGNAQEAQEVPSPPGTGVSFASAAKMLGVKKDWLILTLYRARLIDANQVPVKSMVDAGLTCGDKLNLDGVEAINMVWKDLEDVHHNDPWSVDPVYEFDTVCTMLGISLSKLVDLRAESPFLQTDPITGDHEPWQYEKGYLATVASPQTDPLPHIAVFTALTDAGIGELKAALKKERDVIKAPATLGPAIPGGSETKPGLRLLN